MWWVALGRLCGGAVTPWRSAVVAKNVTVTICCIGFWIGYSAHSFLALFENPLTR